MEGFAVPKCDGTWKEVSWDFGEGQIPAKHPHPVVVVVAPDLALQFEDWDIDVHLNLRVVVPDPFDGRFEILRWADRAKPVAMPADLAPALEPVI